MEIIPGKEFDHLIFETFGAILCPCACCQVIII